MEGVMRCSDMGDEGDDDMANGQQAQRTNSAPKIAFESRRPTLCRDRALPPDSSAEADLRQALAQAEVQLAQMAILIKEQQEELDKLLVLHGEATRRVARLTPRQHQIMELVVAGHPSKNIAADLGISQRSVEGHRAAIRRRMGSMSLPELGRLAFVATWDCAG
jgi:DNA-binding CsgD family transcriptional regulator